MNNRVLPLALMVVLCACNRAADTSDSGQPVPDARLDVRSDMARPDTDPLPDMSPLPDKIPLSDKTSLPDIAVLPDKNTLPDQDQLPDKSSPDKSLLDKVSMPDAGPPSGTAWVFTTGGSGNISKTNVNTDKAGYVYVSGSLDGTAKFGTTTVGTPGKLSVFVLKLNPKGYAF